MFHLSVSGNHHLTGRMTCYEPRAERPELTQQAIFAPATSSPTAAVNGHGIGGSSTTAPPLPAPIPVTTREEPSTPIKTSNEPKLAALSAADIEKTGVSPTNASLEQSLATTSSDSEKLKLALKEIDRLRSELDEARGPQATGLRRRGGGAASGGSATEVAVEKAKEVVQGNQGVPLEIVGALVFTVFVMTYMFF